MVIAKLPYIKYFPSFVSDKVSVFRFQGQHIQCLTPDTDETGWKFIKGRIEVFIRKCSSIG